MSFPIAPSRIAQLISANPANVATYWPTIEAALASLNCGSNLACVAALATIRVECPPFKPIHEYGSDALHEQEYENRMGDTAPGDGAKYAGRGFIQITGKNNYATYGKELGVDLVTNPDTALEPNTAAAIFGLFFRDRHIAAAAEAKNWEQVRRLVNGGLNGYADFIKYVNALLAEIND